MLGRTRTIECVVVAVVAMALLGAAATNAHTTRTASEVGINFQDLEFQPGGPPDMTDAFVGQVTSSKASCLKGRRVKVFQNSDPDIPVGSTTTRSLGAWSLGAEDPGDGTYFAAVTQKRSGSGDHKHICKPDRSPNMVVADSLGDSDGDGHLVGEDCDDTDPAINPGATETRDGVDEDCDGLADDLDFDGDTFFTGEDCDDFRSDRNPDATESVNGVDDDCDGAGDLGTSDQDADGFSGSDGDCDDANAFVRPGAEETRNGVDDDCDGLSDNIDADGDGHSTPADCDDTDSTVFPSANETKDGKDEDCDGESDEDF